MKKIFFAVMFVFTQAAYAINVTDVMCSYVGQRASNWGTKSLIGANLIGAKMNGNEKACAQAQLKFQQSEAGDQSGLSDLGVIDVSFGDADNSGINESGLLYSNEVSAVSSVSASGMSAANTIKSGTPLVNHENSAQKSAADVVVAFGSILRNECQKIVRFVAPRYDAMQIEKQRLADLPAQPSSSKEWLIKTGNAFIQERKESFSSENTPVDCYDVYSVDGFAWKYDNGNVTDITGKDIALCGSFLKNKGQESAVALYKNALQFSADLKSPNMLHSVTDPYRQFPQSVKELGEHVKGSKHFRASEQYAVNSFDSFSGTTDDGYVAQDLVGSQNQSTPQKKTSDQSSFDSALSYVKENPVKTGVAVVAAVAVTYGVYHYLKHSKNVTKEKRALAKKLKARKSNYAFA